MSSDEWSVIDSTASAPARSPTPSTISSLQSVPTSLITPSIASAIPIDDPRIIDMQGGKLSAAEQQSMTSLDEMVLFARRRSTRNMIFEPEESSVLPNLSGYEDYDHFFSKPDYEHPEEPKKTARVVNAGADDLRGRRRYSSTIFVEQYTGYTNDELLYDFSQFSSKLFRGGEVSSYSISGDSFDHAFGLKTYQFYAETTRTLEDQTEAKVVSRKSYDYEFKPPRLEKNAGSLLSLEMLPTVEESSETDHEEEIHFEKPSAMERIAESTSGLMKSIFGAFLDPIEEEPEEPDVEEEASLASSMLFLMEGFMVAAQ